MFSTTFFAITETVQNLLSAFNKLEGPILNEEMSIALDALKEASHAVSSIPKDIPGGEPAILRVLSELDHFDASDLATPPDSLWNSIDELQHSYDTYIFNLNRATIVESIESLRQQGVDDTQIARTYELIDDNGQSRPDWVQQEIAHPHSKIPKDWIPTKERDRVARHKAFYDGLEEYRNRDKTPLTPVPVIASETWEELYEMDCDPEQAARMKNVSTEEANRRLKEAGQAIEDRKTDAIAKRMSGSPADSTEIVTGEWLEPDEPEPPTIPSVPIEPSYTEDTKIKVLRDIARKRGLDVKITMRKVDVLELLKSTERLQATS